MHNRMNNGTTSITEVVNAAAAIAGTSPFPAIVSNYSPAFVGAADDIAWAIAEHYSAWVNFQLARGREASLAAEEVEADAMLKLLSTSVHDEASLNALVAHLEWYSLEERQFRSGLGVLNDLPFVTLDNLQLALRLQPAEQLKLLMAIEVGK